MVLAWQGHGLRMDEMPEEEHISLSPLVSLILPHPDSIALRRSSICFCQRVRFDEILVDALSRQVSLEESHDVKQCLGISLSDTVNNRIMLSWPTSPSPVVQKHLQNELRYVACFTPS